MRQKVVEGSAGLSRGDRPVELGQAAWMAGESGIHKIDHATGDHIGREANGRWQPARPSLRKRPAVFGVEVPLAAGGLALVHEHAKLLSQRAVEVFKPQLLASRRVLGELLS